MPADGFRFGVSMMVPTARREWVDKCRRAEDLGFDVVAVPDHLHAPAPFPALMLAAEATARVRVATMVLSTPFYSPALLARDAVGADRFTDGRLEIGLGAGYVKEEFERAALPFGTPGERVDHLERTLDALDRARADAPSGAGPALLIGGNGDRVLRLAAARARTVAFPGLAFARDGTPRLQDAAEIAERIAFADAAADGRVVERNMLLQRVLLTEDRAGTLAQVSRQLGGRLGPERLGEAPSVLAGSAAQIEEQLHAHRERLGLTYFTALEPHMDALAQVLARLR